MHCPEPIKKNTTDNGIDDDNDDSDACICFSVYIWAKGLLSIHIIPLSLEA